MFERVLRYMGLGDARVKVGFYAEERDGPIGPMQPGITYSSDGTAGLYIHGSRSRLSPDDEQTIWVEVRQLAKPLALVATMAHELGHVHLIGHGRITNEVEDHEPLTDLLTVFFGLGVLTANSLIHEENWTYLNTGGWSVGRLGYLSQLEAGYALALFAWLRGEDRPAWAAELCADVRAPLKQGLRFLGTGKVSPQLATVRAGC
jgi:hypothetical protein